MLHTSISREVSLRNSYTTIKAYYNHMCKKCYFPGYKNKTKKAAFIFLIKLWLSSLHFSFQDPQNAVFYSFQLNLNSKVVSWTFMPKPLGWLTPWSHRYKLENSHRYKFWASYYCSSCTEALGFHPVHNFLFYTE